jgi:polyhydroxyalkanoate synthesis regulator protein
MLGGMPGWASSGPAPDHENAPSSSNEIADIKKQLEELQKKLSKL